MSDIIEINDLHFAFAGTTFRLQVDELRVSLGETVAFIGSSGSGKTTLLHLLAGIRTPESGSVTVVGRDVSGLATASSRDHRVCNIGLVFQEFELLEHLSVLDNILLPYRISAALKLTREIVDRAQQLAESVDINDKLGRYPGRLSQGERQRVAVCRALLTEPPLVLADEPTGNLDPGNKWKVVDALIDDAKRRQSTLVTVTHDHELLDRFDRVIDFSSFHASSQTAEVAT
ncbi:putative ABC transporter ATP-binding protein [Planctomycetes bacterium CA13]|uniref:Putative ABC transporter ATP-binding protein n=1 Tax=Novipirellula herctigrandis TaxID=2527986 RepID=A0A5C5Z1W1_9BACT|nr:putative ABC transporter ATP-binding protein [Planctomycetes bacterium CA13]